MDTKSKSCIVTGASRGIGRAIAIKLSQLGYRVVGVYKSSDKLAKQLERQHNILTVKADVGNENDVKRVIKETVNNYGTLDVVVNNAGIDIFGDIEKYETKDWNSMVDTNLKSVFLFSKYSIPYLRKSKNPVIINISSRIGFPEYTEAQFVVYGAVKAAVTNFTVGLSKELVKTGIRVNAVIPTPTKTDLFDEVFTSEEEKALIKKGKLGKPEDVANLVNQLIQDKTVNGKILMDTRVNL